jgi:hypothetical protein
MLVPIIRDAVISLVKEFEGMVFEELRNTLIHHDASFKKYFLSPEERVPYVLSHIHNFSCIHTSIDLQESIY